MALWFLRGLRKGVVTTRYPARSAADAWAGSLPTPPRFEPGKLSEEMVGRLVELCPSGALSRDDGHLVLDLGACSSCGRCLVVAAGAARPSGVFELAATRRHDLVKRIPVRPA